MGCCGIVILNYNTPIDTINCIKSILKYNTALIKVVVVDNASSDDSLRKIKEFTSSMPFVSIIESEQNLGYARGNNLGIDLLKKDTSVEYIMILNSDVLFVEDIIPTLLQNLSEKNIAIISPVLYKKNMQEYDYNCARLAPSFLEIFIHFLLLAHEPKFLKNRRYILKKANQEKNIIPIDLPSGSCMLFSKETCADLGIFDPNTFLYYEENIIAKRLEKKSIGQIYVNLNLKCIHLGAVSTKKEPSQKIVEAEVQSALYYVRTFSENKFFKKIFFVICCFYLKLDSIKRLIKKRGIFLK